MNRINSYSKDSMKATERFSPGPSKRATLKKVSN